MKDEPKPKKKDTNKKKKTVKKPVVKAKEEKPKEKTKEADYVWLPIRFDGDKPYIEWLDEWRTEDFE